MTEIDANSGLERRQITVMFCDLVGSTALSERLDPEDLNDVLRLYRATCAAAIVRRGGFLAQYVGDGVVAYFGYPRAYEDTAERAVRSGLEVIESVSRLRPVSGAQLSVRVGLATGLTVVGNLVAAGSSFQTSATGRVPNLAARIQGCAEPDTLAIADDTKRLLGDLFDFRDLGPQLLKGIEAPERVWQVLGERAGGLRLDLAGAADRAHFVGRDREKEALAERWRKAASGDGQAVVVEGEAGIGKSRLVAELSAALAGEPHYTVRLQCLELASESTFYPIAQHLRRAAGFERGDPDDVRLVKFEALLDLSGGRDGMSDFAELAGVPVGDRYPRPPMAAAQRRALLLAAFGNRLVARSAAQPVLVLVEDAHWIDPSTNEALALIVERTVGNRVMLVVTCRPGYRPSWLGRANVATIRLDRLSRRATERVIARTAGSAALTPSLVAEILAKSDGIPLFAEEVTKAVLEVKASSPELVKEGYGQLHRVPVPATLQDSLMARLDRMPAGKKVAQIASVLGRSFTVDALAALARDVPVELDLALTQLSEAGVLLKDGDEAQTAYRFRHALIRDIAYQSLLKGRRQHYHARCAAILADRPEVAENAPEVVARHFTEAGVVSEAIRYWHRAGSRATERSANLEAVAHFRQALALVSALPDDEARVRQEYAALVGLMPPLMASQGYAAPEMERAIARARELSERIEDTTQLLLVLNAGISLARVGGRVLQAKSAIEEFASLARRQPTDDARYAVRLFAGSAPILQGDPQSGRKLTEEALDAYDLGLPQPSPFSYGHDNLIAGLGYLSLACWILGLPDEAARRRQQALDRARMLKHPNTIAASLFFATFLSALGRDQASGEDYARELIALSREQNFALWLGAGSFLAGALAAEAGHLDRAIVEMKGALEAMRALKVGLFRPCFLSMLAAAQGRAGLVAEAAQSVEEAVSLIESLGERWIEPEVLRVRADLLALGGDPERAEQGLNASLALARRQKATGIELRVATSLARLLSGRGRRGEAEDILGRSARQATLGRDFPDLVEARDLLQQLRQA